MTAPRFELTSQRQKVSRLLAEPQGQPAQYNKGGFLPDIMIQPKLTKRFDIPPLLTAGCSEGLHAFRYFFKIKEETETKKKDGNS